jgi:hypothetical protein
MYGVPGQAQHGIDLLAAPRSSPETVWSYQCKKVDDFGPADVRAAIKRFEEGPWATQTNEFTLCVASSLESTQVTEAIVEERQRLAGRGVVLHIWDGAPSGELNTLLKNLPAIVDDFFSREWVRAFNGEDEANSLGERLDGVDFARLRGRLSDLYRVVFSQHDPGLRTSRVLPTDYSQRYVEADVVETALVRPGDTAASERREGLEDASPPATNQPEQQRQALPASVVGAYSMRRPVKAWLEGKESCIVLGEPGHGKSTLLRQLAIALNTPEFSEKAPLDADRPRRLPVWMSFARFAAAISEDPSANVEDFFCSWLHQHGYDDVQPLFRRALRDSKLIFLVDGLDEGTEAGSGREALDRVITFVASHQAIILCTSRPRSFASLPVPATWPVATLAPLNDRQIQEFATRWFAITERASPDEASDAVLARARPRGEGFVNAIKASARTHDLARNPLLCQLLIELYRLSHRLPEARTRAYAEIIDLFLRRHPEARAHAGFSERPPAIDGLRDTDLQDILTAIAFDTQSRAMGDVASRERCVALCAEFLEDDVAGLGLPRPKSTRRASDIIELFVSYFGILIERSPGELGFVHLSLQEYLAGKAMARLPDSDQLDWVRNVAMLQRWRECLTSWFGIQGESGHRVVTARANQLLAEVGQSGEWERLQMLALQTYLATTDQGLPIGEARSVLKQSVHEVETSPFQDVRAQLARSITIGALGSSIREECASAIASWCPGRSRFERTRLLEAFSSWSPAADLERTLRRALLDEHFECRRAAAHSYARLFGSVSEAASALTDIARFDARPTARAAALRALMEGTAWSSAASDAADWNIRSHDPELQIACIGARIRARRHTAEDLDRLLEILPLNGIDYGLQHELHALICSGWPRDEGLRSRCLAFMGSEAGTSELAFPIEYLIKGYPHDDDVARVLGRLIDRYGMHLSLDSGRLWALLSTAYAGHPVIVEAARQALNRHKEKFAEIMWHPDTVPVYLVLADDQARDELIAAYEKADADLHGRYWIAATLIRGWPDDEFVGAAIRQWVSGSVGVAAPLAEYSKKIIPADAERRGWLERMVREADSRVVSRPIAALLDERPDERAWGLIWERLQQPEIWYYDRMHYEAQVAAIYPDHDESRKVVERAFTESDGPPISVLADGYQNDGTVRQRLLAAAAPASDDVRLAVASALKERGGPAVLMEQLTPGLLTEATSAVRATGLIARAHAYRHDASRSGSFIELLLAEAEAIGTEMDRRRRTAVAALLEIGQVPRVAQILADAKRDSPYWYDFLDRDLVSLGVLLDHWHDIDEAAKAQGLSVKVPAASLIEAGYGPFLERVPGVRAQLEEEVLHASGELRRQNLEILARLHPRSPMLRSALIRSIETRGLTLPRGRQSCLATRLLGEHFGPDPTVLEEIFPQGPPSELTPGAPGVLGHLVRSWPSSTIARLAHGCGSDERQRWWAIDRLICATVWGGWGEAATAAREVIAQRYRYGYVESEDAEALRIWARCDESLETIVRWRDSGDGEEATAALILLAARSRVPVEDSEQIREHFNRAATDRTGPPADGFDPVTGKTVAWLQKAYELLARFG